MATPPKIISIEACIGAGKSTLLKALEDRGYTVLYEPINNWENWHGTNPLQEMYTSDKMLHFQLLALATRARSIKQLLLHDSGFHKGNFIFVERLAGISENIFMKIALEDGKLLHAEVATLTLTIEMMGLPKADAIIYLNTHHIETRKRIRKRARESEATMPSKLNERLRTLHNIQFLDAYTMTDNTERDIDDMLASISHKHSGLNTMRSTQQQPG